MAITGYRKNLVDWNETGNNSKLKISQANIKKENDLKEECKACYIDSGIPLPKDIVKSMIVTLHDIRNSSSPREKEKGKRKMLLQVLPYLLCVRREKTQTSIWTKPSKSPLRA